MDIAPESIPVSWLCELSDVQVVFAGSDLLLKSYPEHACLQDYHRLCGIHIQICLAKFGTLLVRGVSGLRNRLSYLWIVIAVVLFPFANGRWVIPIAVWIAPMLLIRYMKSARGIWRYVACYIVLYIGLAIGFHGVVPGIMFYIIIAFFTLVTMIPYVVHLLISPKLQGFLSTLVFPLCYVIIEYIESLISPYGSWMSYAYTQYGNLPLLQIISVTGLWGITFIVMWFNTVVDWAWDRQFKLESIRRGAGSFVLLLICVLSFGALRLAFFSPNSPTVQVATISAPEPNQQIAAVIANPNVTNAQWQSFRSSAKVIQDNLLAQTSKQAAAGAKIILWGECDGIVAKEDAQSFILQGEQLAHQKHVYLGMSLWVMTRNLSEEKYKDEVVWITPQGHVAGIYKKSKLVPPTEPYYYSPGDGRLLISDTPYGKIGIAICFDADFPSLIQQAGRNHVGLLLVPSGDWRAIDPLHTQMATFRAIENGFSLVRGTTSGLSIATDNLGHTLSAVDYFNTSGGHVMVSQVYTKRTATIYSRIGNLFAWLCIFGLLLLILISFNKRNQN